MIYKSLIRFLKVSYQLKGRILIVRQSAILPFSLMPFVGYLNIVGLSVYFIHTYFLAYGYLFFLMTAYINRVRNPLVAVITNHIDTYPTPINLSYF